MGSQLVVGLLLGAVFCLIASSEGYYLDWDAVEDPHLRNYRKGFPAGATVDSLMPVYPRPGVRWSDLMYQWKQDKLWGHWDPFYHKFMEDPHNNELLTQDQKKIVFIFFVCKETNSDLEPYCPRPCIYDTPCEGIRHALPDGCIQANRSITVTDFQCACEYGYVWDNDRRKCLEFDICSTNPCQAYREMECDVSYEGYDCQCTEEKTNAGMNTYSCACSDPFESQFKWTIRRRSHSYGGMAQGVMSVEACKVKCQYLLGCSVISYQNDLRLCFVYNQTYNRDRFSTPHNDEYHLERITTFVPGKQPFACQCSGGKCDLMPEWAAWGEWGPCEPLCAPSGNKWRSRHCSSSTTRCTGNRAGSETCVPAPCSPGAAQSGSTGSVITTNHRPASSTGDSSKTGSSKKVVIGVIIVAIAVVIGFGIVCTRKKKEEPEEQFSSTEVKMEAKQNESLLSNLPKAASQLTSKISRTSQGGSVGTIGSGGTDSSSETSLCTKGSNRNMSNSHTFNPYTKVRHGGLCTNESIYGDPHRDCFTAQYDKNVRQSTLGYDGLNKASSDQPAVSWSAGYNLSGPLSKNNYIRSAEIGGPMQYDDYSKVGQVSHDYSKAGKVDGKGVPVPYDDYYQLDPACSSHGSLADYGRMKNRVTPCGVNNMNDSGINKHHAKSEHISDESKKKQKKVRNSKKT